MQIIQILQSENLESNIVCYISLVSARILIRRLVIIFAFRFRFSNEHDSIQKLIINFLNTS